MKIKYKIKPYKFNIGDWVTHISRQNDPKPFIYQIGNIDRANVMIKLMAEWYPEAQIIKIDDHDNRSKYTKIDKKGNIIK